MTREEALELMLNSINEDNREFCKMASIPDEEAESQIAQSQPTLQVIVSNMYDRMKAASIIA